MNDNDMTNLVEALKAEHPGQSDEWGKVSTNLRTVIAAVALGASGRGVNFKSVADAGGFDRARFTAKPSRSDQQTANDRRRAIVDGAALGRLLEDLLGAEVEESAATQLVEANATISQTRSERDAAIQSRGEIATYARMLHREQQPVEPLKGPRRTTGGTVVDLFPNATTTNDW